MGEHWSSGSHPEHNDRGVRDRETDPKGHRGRGSQLRGKTREPGHQRKTTVSWSVRIMTTNFNHCTKVLFFDSFLVFIYASLHVYRKEMALIS